MNKTHIYTILHITQLRAQLSVECKMLYVKYIILCADLMTLGRVEAA